MSNDVSVQVEFRLRANDPDEIVEKLANFFAPVASSRIQKPELVYKAIEPLEIIMTIARVGAEAAAVFALERYVLIPLMERADNWWASINSLWSRSQVKRRLLIMGFEAQLSGNLRWH